MDIFPDSTTGWVIYISITVILGAVGAAFWEVVLRPASTRIGNKLFNLFARIVAISSGRIYQDIAARVVDKPNLFSTALTIFIFTVILGGASTWIVLLKDPDYQIIPDEAISQMSSEELDELLHNNEIELHEINKDLALGLLTFSLFGIIFTGYFYLRNAFVISGVRYFDQAMSICAPYIDDTDQKKLLSEFSLVSNEAQFKSVLVKLNDIAAKNKIELPLSFLLD